MPSETFEWEHNITNFNLSHIHKYQIFTISFYIYSDIPNNIFPKCCIDKFVLSFQESTLWDKEIKWHVWKCRPANEKLTNTDGGLRFYPRSCTSYYLITSCIKRMKPQTMWKYSSVQSSPTSKKYFCVWIFPGLSAYPSAKSNIKMNMSMENRWDENEWQMKKPAPLPCLPLQISRGLTWDRARSSVLRGRRITA
jgi:hypothetical protein